MSDAEATQAPVFAWFVDGGADLEAVVCVAACLQSGQADPPLAVPSDALQPHLISPEL